MKGSWLRFNDDLFPLYTIDPASLGFSASTTALFGDYQQLPSFSSGVGDGDRNGTRREARGPAERLQQRTHAAVLQRPDCSDADQDRRLAYLQVRIRLAAAAPGRNQSRMESRGLRVRRHLHALDQRRHESVRPGHRRRSCSGFPLNDVDHRNAQQLRRARQQPRRLRARRLARVRSADAGPRHPLRPRAGPAARSTTATSAGSISRRPIRSKRRRAPTSRRIRPRACRSAASAFNVRGGYTYLSGDQKSAWNADRNNFQPRAGFTYKLSDNARCCAAASGSSSRRSRFRACPASRPASIRSAIRAARRCR